MHVCAGSATPKPERERPLSLRVRLKESAPLVEALLAMTGPLKRKTALAASAILANFHMDPEAIIFYSRDTTHYSDRAVRHYYPGYYTYASVTSAVDALVVARLVEESRTAPSPNARTRSTLRATARLAALIDASPHCEVQAVQTELIELRTAGKSKRLLPYDDTDAIRAMRADVQAHNDFQALFSVDLDGACSASSMLSLAARLYHRVFTGDFDYGGRWYAPWQSIKKELRSSITIDGRPTFEFDYSCCHARLLSAMAGLDLPFGVDGFDFYSCIPGFERAEVKAAVPILLNADSVRRAVDALAFELPQRGQPTTRARVRALCRAIKAAWPVLSPYWCTGIGLGLQRVDADICAEIQADMRAMGIPILSIHDGFIVPVEFSRALTDSANAGMETACRRLREHPIGI